MSRFSEEREFKHKHTRTMKAKHTGLTSLIIALQLIFCVNMVHAQASNPVNIPDTLHGPVFDLDILDTTKQFFPTGS